jgi:hypothetical protein
MGVETGMFDEPTHPCARFFRKSTSVESIDADVTPVSPAQTEQNAHRRGLSCSVVAKKPYDLARLQFKAQRLQGLHGP